MSGTNFAAPEITDFVSIIPNRLNPITNAGFITTIQDILNLGGSGGQFLPISGGTLTGPLTQSSGSPLQIGPNASYQTATPNVLLQLAGPGTTGLEIDAFGAGVPVYYGRQAAGTFGAPTATASGATLWTARGLGYNGSAYTGTGGAASIAMLAAEPFGSTANGTLIDLSITKPTTTALSRAMRLAWSTGSISGPSLIVGGTTSAYGIDDQTGNGINTTGPLAVAGTATHAGIINITGAGTAYTWTGSNFTQAPLSLGALASGAAVTWFGTVPAIGGPATLGFYLSIGVDLDASLATGGSYGGRIVMASNPLQQGGITGFSSEVAINQASANAGILRGYTAGHFSASQSILDQTSLNNIIGVGASTQISGAAAVNTMYGMEVDTNAISGAGASVLDKIGLIVVGISTDLVRGSVSDAGIQLVNQYQPGATAGRKVGLLFGGAGRASLYSPVAQDGTYIGVSLGVSETPITVVSFADWSAITTFTGPQLKGVGFSVGSTGIPASTGLSGSTTYANDAAAAVGGVAVGGFYRNGSVVQCRIT